ncbi:MAG: putative bifunctional diguanylate cyclase/phosphodiesterase, partial [Mycobacteriales bacterium]
GITLRLEGEQMASALRGTRVTLWWAFGCSALLILLVAALSRTSWQLAQSRLRESEAVRAHEERIEYLAYHDDLTTLPNRSLFSKLLGQSIGQARRFGRQLAVLILDLDRFKYINDTLGHEAGDKLLQCVARRLHEAVRPTDTVARFGGDEFAVVCPGLHEEVLARELGARLLAEVSAPIVLGSRVHVPSVSLGISLTPPGAVETPEVAVGNADVALYVAKKRGKARYEVYAEPLRTGSSERMRLLGELRTALAEDQLEVHYQPQLSLRTGELVAVEALVRWRHPSRGLLTAGDFIDGVEEGGLAGPLGAWVLEQSCLALRAWPGPRPPRMAVNISPRQFSLPGFVGEAAALLDRTGVSPEQLELEVTEAALLVDDSVAQVLRDLDGLGIRLAVDDFGTGFSSLNHLKMFPASTVKIDRSFVAGLGSDATDEAIVAAVLGVARSLGLSTVGEGVETPEQRERLHELGCELGQGYLLGKALPPDVLYADWA